MSRQSWVYRNKEGGGVEVFEKGSEPDLSTDAKHNVLAGDRHYDGMQATDGTDISTRTKHREYMKKNGVTTMDDFKSVWQGAQKQRDEYRTTGKGGAVTREDIARTIAHLERR
jgi:hypothetical protein